MMDLMPFFADAINGIAYCGCNYPPPGLAKNWSVSRILGETGRGAAWLARLLWEQEVAGSNPVAPIFVDS